MCIQKGSDFMEYWENFSSPLGNLLLQSDGEALTGLSFSDEKLPENPCPVFLPVKNWLCCYFGGRDPGAVPVRLSPKGTPFQKQIWTLLLDIPYGECCTYGGLAARISPGMSSQAVGAAVGKNPIALLIPCHRVLGAGGKLTGYAWGLTRKQFLLDLEQK